MGDYFNGEERLQVFPKTGHPMRMGDLSKLMVTDYQVARNLVTQKKWEEALSYLTIFHAQNVGMNNLLVDWCVTMTKFYAELTSVDKEKNLREKALQDFAQTVMRIGKIYTEVDDLKTIIKMREYFTFNNLPNQTSTLLVVEMENDLNQLTKALNEKNESESLKLINRFNRNAVIRHDSLISFIYSYPTTIMMEDDEEMALEVANGSVLKNQSWNGLWELTKVLNPTDLAAFLAEHLRFHFSGLNCEGQTQIIEDDKKIRLIFDPCGSGGALRRRLGDDIKTVQGKHNLSWNKSGEVNLYCTHCALNEKKSIDMFGHPKLVVEFQADPNKPCGWTFYKNQKDIPKEVYDRLGIKV